MAQDTIQVVTKMVAGIDSCGNATMTAIGSYKYLAELTDGIGYIMFFYAFIGFFIHFLFKWINGINEKKSKGEPFYFIAWLQDNIPILLFSLITGECAVFAVSQYWQPVTVTKSIVAGLLAGSVIFNILPSVINFVQDKIISKLKS